MSTPSVLLLGFVRSAASGTGTSRPAGGLVSSVCTGYLNGAEYSTHSG